MEATGKFLSYLLTQCQNLAILVSYNNDYDSTGAYDMIPVKTNDVNVQGNFDGEKIAMTIDDNALAHIMAVLTDLYSDPELAVIREYSTNGLDSHVAAGQVRPIEVFLPSALNSKFIVQDFGVGLSVDDIRNVYSKYGASTKQGTNDQVGMLGLGCKSALTYVNQFIVTAVKGGVKSHVAIGRNEDGTGTMEVIDTCATNEPNGVRIEVPVRNERTFNEKASNFFKFWKPGTVLVNGKAPVTTSLTKVVDSLFMDKESRDDYIVMGNVAYPLTYEYSLANVQRKNFGVVAFVDIGDVNFTPNREALHYTHITKNTISKIRDTFTTAYKAAIFKDIENQPTHMEAAKAYQTWYAVLGQEINSATYKGLKIPSYVNTAQQVTMFHHRRSHGAVHNTTQISFADFGKSVVVTGFKAASITATHKKKIRQWINENTITEGIVVLTDTMFGAPWTDASNTVDFSVINAIKVTSTSSYGYSRKTKDIAGSFHIINPSGGKVEEVLEASNDEIVYVTPAQFKEIDYIGNMVQLASNVKFAIVGENRMDKFKRDFPNAISYRDKQAAVKVRIEASITEADKVINSLDSRFIGSVGKLDPALILDPELRLLIELSKNSTTVNLKNVESFNRSCYGSYYANSISVGKTAMDASAIVRKYPLLKIGYDAPNVKHTTLYVNAVYTATLDGTL